MPDRAELMTEFRSLIDTQVQNQVRECNGGPGRLQHKWPGYDTTARVGEVVYATLARNQASGSLFIPTAEAEHTWAAYTRRAVRVGQHVAVVAVVSTLASPETLHRGLIVPTSLVGFHVSREMTTEPELRAAVKWASTGDTHTEDFIHLAEPTPEEGAAIDHELEMVRDQDEVARTGLARLAEMHGALPHAWPID